MRIICNVLIFKYYIKNRALWSIPVFIKKVNDMQVFLFISTIFVFLILLHLWLLFSDNIYNEEIKKDGMSVVL